MTAAACKKCGAVNSISRKFEETREAFETLEVSYCDSKGELHEERTGDVDYGTTYDGVGTLGYRCDECEAETSALKDLVEQAAVGTEPNVDYSPGDLVYVRDRFGEYLRTVEDVRYKRTQQGLVVACVFVSGSSDYFEPAAVRRAEPHEIERAA